MSQQQDRQALRKAIRKAIKTPVHLLSLADDDISSGRVKLYSWQEEALSKIGKKRTSQKPMEMVMRAINGSGKDQMIIAPFALYMIMTSPYGLVVITTASANQMDTQTFKYIETLAAGINKLFRPILGDDLLKVKRNPRKVECKLFKSSINMFVTDEEGRAEGYHPPKDKAQLCIIVNEAKSVDDRIFNALERCTGWTHWLEISSPGSAEGHFYKSCMSNRTGVYRPVITIDDCPHFTKSHVNRLIERMGGIDHPLVRSMLFAEFASDDADVVVSMHMWNELMKAIKANSIKHHREVLNTGGLDFGFGNNETVLTVRNGNKVVGRKVWKLANAALLCESIRDAAEHFNLNNSKIYADAHGIGKVIISMLRENYGVRSVVPVFSSRPAYDKKSYLNLNSESWFNLRKLFNDRVIIVDEDATLQKQVTNRMYEVNNTGKICLIEKKEQRKAFATDSPDWADSLVLAFIDYKAPEELEYSDKKDDDLLYDQYRLALIGEYKSESEDSSIISTRVLVQEANEDNKSGLEEDLPEGIYLETQVSYRNSNAILQRDFRKNMRWLKQELKNRNEYA